MNKQKYLWIIRLDKDWGMRGERRYEYLYSSKGVTKKTLKKFLIKEGDKKNKLAKLFLESGKTYEIIDYNFNTPFDIFKRKLV